MDQILSESRGFDPSSVDQMTSSDEHGSGDLTYSHLRMCLGQSKSFKVLTVGHRNTNLYPLQRITKNQFVCKHQLLLIVWLIG